MNVYAYYGDRSSELSSGLPRDAATARQFFDRSLRAAWISSKSQPYDFLVQSAIWKLGAVSISIVRKQFDKTYVAAGFANQDRAVTLNFIVVNGPDGWVILDVESPHDSLRFGAIQELAVADARQPILFSVLLMLVNISPISFRIESSFWKFSKTREIL